MPPPILVLGRHLSLLEVEVEEAVSAEAAGVLTSRNEHPFSLGETPKIKTANRHWI